MDAPPAPPAAAYGQRNIFYLRVSPTLVLPCVLYLDARHVPWLNAHPSVFNAALNFLKGRILQKLDREAKVIKVPVGGGGGGGGAGGGGPTWEKRLWGEMSGREVVDVSKQPEFHLAYFFRRQADRHGVLLKDKQLLFPGGGAGAGAGAAAPQRKRRRVDEDTHADAGQPAEQEERGDGTDQPPPAPVHIKPDPDAEEQDSKDFLMLGETGPDAGEGMGDSAANPLDPTADLGDDADTKPKFKLKVRYQGFRIFTKALVLVLEPSPSARARSPELFASQTPTQRRQLSAVPLAERDSTRGSTAVRDPRPAGLRSSVGVGKDGEDGDGEGETRGSVRDARSSSRSTRRTPLFRGSMTPSDFGSPAPAPAFTPTPTSGPGAEGDRQRSTDAAAGTGADADAEREGAEDLAQQMLSQDPAVLSGTRAGGREGGGVGGDEED